jgi:hypothetical protein
MGLNLYDSPHLLSVHPAYKITTSTSLENTEVSTETHKVPPEQIKQICFQVMTLCPVTMFKHDNFIIQWKPNIRFAWGTSILDLRSRKKLNVHYIKMEQKINHLVIKTLIKCRICITWPYVRTNKVKYNCSKRKDACIYSRWFTSWKNPKQMSVLLDTSDVLFFTQCFLFCSHFYYFKQESATNTKTHTWKFTVHLQSSLSTIDLEIHMCKLTMGSQAQPFNSTVNSWKNTLSGCVALLHGSGREGSDLSNHKMEEMTSDTFLCLQTC